MCTAIISVSTQEKEQKFMLDSKGGEREGWWRETGRGEERVL